MKSKRVILCIGVQVEIIHSMETFFSQVDKDFFEYEFIFYKDIEEYFLKIQETKVPSFIVMNFCELEQDNDSCHEIVSVFKGYSLFKSIPLIGIFDNAESINQNASLFGIGVNYAHILGNDPQQFLTNIYYISFEDESYNKDYAMAKGFTLESKAQLLVYLSEIQEEALIYDSDISFKTDTISTQVNLFKDFNATDLPIIESFKGGKLFNTFNSDHLKIPFATGWDESPTALAADTYESWIEMNKEDFSTRSNNILFFSKNRKILSPLNELLKEHKTINFTLREQFVSEDKEILKLNSQFIFFEITDEEDFDHMDELLNELSNLQPKYTPFIIIFNCDSASAALQKVYNLKTVLATPKKANLKNLNDMVSILESKSKNINNYLFKNDQRVVSYYNLDVKMTSITENEVTFQSYTEIPMYTVLKLNIPIEMYLLVIPPFKKLRPLPDGFHYQCFVMGINEKNSEYLRKYVNRLISKKPTSWMHISFDEDIKIEDPTSEDDNGSSQIHSKEEFLEKKSKDQQDAIKETTKEERIKSQGLKSKL